jgi:hypothetical protein
MNKLQTLKKGRWVQSWYSLEVREWLRRNHFCCNILLRGVFRFDI